MKVRRRARRCGTCRWFEKDESLPETAGYCHRFPPKWMLGVHPTPLAGGESTIFTPIGCASDWCGEWAPRLKR